MTVSNNELRMRSYGLLCWATSWLTNWDICSWVHARIRPEASCAQFGALKNCETPPRGRCYLSPQSKLIPDKLVSKNGQEIAHLSSQTDAPEVTSTSSRHKSTPLLSEPGYAKPLDENTKTVIRSLDTAPVSQSARSVPIQWIRAQRTGGGAQPRVNLSANVFGALRLDLAGTWRNRGNVRYTNGHLYDVIVHGIEHQLADGVEPEFSHDVTAMRLRCLDA